MKKWFVTNKKAKTPPEVKKKPNYQRKERKEKAVYLPFSPGGFSYTTFNLNGDLDYHGNRHFTLNGSSDYGISGGNYQNNYVNTTNINNNNYVDYAEVDDFAEQIDQNEDIEANFERFILSAMGNGAAARSRSKLQSLFAEQPQELTRRTDDRTSKGSSVQDSDSNHTYNSGDSQYRAPVYPPGGGGYPGTEHYDGLEVDSLVSDISSSYTPQAELHRIRENLRQKREARTNQPSVESGIEGNGTYGHAVEGQLMIPPPPDTPPPPVPDIVNHSSSPNQSRGHRLDRFERVESNPMPNLLQDVNAASLTSNSTLTNAPPTVIAKFSDTLTSNEDGYFSEHHPNNVARESRGNYYKPAANRESVVMTTTQERQNVVLVKHDRRRSGGGQNRRPTESSSTSSADSKQTKTRSKKPSKPRHIYIPDHIQSAGAEQPGKRQSLLYKDVSDWVDNVQIPPSPEGSGQSADVSSDLGNEYHFRGNTEATAEFEYYRQSDPVRKHRPPLMPPVGGPDYENIDPSLQIPKSQVHRAFSQNSSSDISRKDSYDVTHGEKRVMFADRLTEQLSPSTPPSESPPTAPPPPIPPPLPTSGSFVKLFSKDKSGTDLHRQSSSLSSCSSQSATSSSKSGSFPFKGLLKPSNTNTKQNVDLIAELKAAKGKASLKKVRRPSDVKEKSTNQKQDEFIPRSSLRHVRRPSDAVRESREDTNSPETRHKNSGVSNDQENSPKIILISKEQYVPMNYSASVYVSGQTSSVAKATTVQPSTNAASYRCSVVTPTLPGSLANATARQLGNNNMVSNQTTSVHVTFDPARRRQEENLAPQTVLCSAPPETVTPREELQTPVVTTSQLNTTAMMTTALHSVAMETGGDLAPLNLKEEAKSSSDQTRDVFIIPKESATKPTNQVERHPVNHNKSNDANETPPVVTSELFRRLKERKDKIDNDVTSDNVQDDRKGLAPWQRQWLDEQKQEHEQWLANGAEARSEDTGKSPDKNVTFDSLKIETENVTEDKENGSDVTPPRTKETNQSADQAGDEMDQLAPWQREAQSRMRIVPVMKQE